MKDKKTTIKIILLGLIITLAVGLVAFISGRVTKSGETLVAGEDTATRFIKEATTLGDMSLFSKDYHIPIDKELFNEKDYYNNSSRVEQCVTANEYATVEFSKAHSCSAVYMTENNAIFLDSIYASRLDKLELVSSKLDRDGQQLLVYKAKIKVNKGTLKDDKISVYEGSYTTDNLKVFVDSKGKVTATNMDSELGQLSYLWTGSTVNIENWKEVKNE